MRTVAELVKEASRLGMAIPAFNIPYLPMMEPVAQVLRDTRCFGFIAVARLEWTKFQARGLDAVRAEYERVKDERFTRLHLDHVPVIDEDRQPVNYKEIISRALALGYDSVMIDGSRLSLEENIRVTREVVEMAHRQGAPVEAELGSIFGHETDDPPPYEEMFRKRLGFTDPQEARFFVERTGVDWLSVAVGSIHGAIAAGRKERRKEAARLDIEHLARIKVAVDIPLVLHGGTGISSDCLRQAIEHGIVKVNVATVIRQAYEAHQDSGPDVAQQAAYRAAMNIIQNELRCAGSSTALGLLREE